MFYLKKKSKLFLKYCEKQYDDTSPHNTKNIKKHESEGEPTVLRQQHGVVQAAGDGDDAVPARNDDARGRQAAHLHARVTLGLARGHARPGHRRTRSFRLRSLFF